MKGRTSLETVANFDCTAEFAVCVHEAEAGVLYFETRPDMSNQQAYIDQPKGKKMTLWHALNENYMSGENEKVE